MFSPKTTVSLKSIAQKFLQYLHNSGVNLIFQPSPYPKMPGISISAEGIGKLFKGLNPHKTAGPDKFKLNVLQTLHKELSPILQLIFQTSLDTGKLLNTWKEANVSPIEISMKSWSAAVGVCFSYGPHTRPLIYLKWKQYNEGLSGG